MKYLLAKCFRRFGYIIANEKKFRLVPTSPNLPPSRLNLLSVAIRAMIADGKDPFIVQVGASDGTLNDPLYPTLLKFKLRALLVEPEPHSFAELQSKYSKLNNIIVDNNAISSVSGMLSLYRYVSRENSHQIGKLQLTSSNRDLLIGHGVSQEEIEKVDVPCLTLRQLLSKYNLSQVDVLQVDVEGSDDQVVYSALELEKLPAIIHFEHVHIPFPRKDKLMQELFKRGYEFAHTGMDTLAFKGENIPTHGMQCGT